MVKVEELCNIEKQSLKSCGLGVGSVFKKIFFFVKLLPLGQICCKLLEGSSWLLNVLVFLLVCSLAVCFSWQAAAASFWIYLLIPHSKLLFPLFVSFRFLIPVSDKFCGRTLAFLEYLRWLPGSPLEAQGGCKVVYWGLWWNPSWLCAWPGVHREGFADEMQ